MMTDHDHTAGYVPSAVAVVPEAGAGEPIPMAGMRDLHDGQAQRADAPVSGTAVDHQQVLQHEREEIVPRRSGRVRRASVVRQPPGEADQQQQQRDISNTHPPTPIPTVNKTAAKAKAKASAKGKERTRPKQRDDEDSSESSSEKDVELALLIAESDAPRARQTDGEAEADEQYKHGDRKDSSADGSVVSTTDHAIRDKDLRDLTKSHGMQSQRAARAIVRGTFPFAKQRALALAVFLAAIESAKQNGRKRVMLKKDVEPALIVAKGVISVLMLAREEDEDSRCRRGTKKKEAAMKKS